MKLVRTSASAAILVAAMILGLFTMSRAQSTPAASNPPPTKLAVVNIVTLFDGLDEKVAADQEIDKLKRGYEEESRKMQATIEDMKAGLKAFTAGTAEYRRAQDDLLKKAMDLQSFSTFAQQKLFLELRVRTADIYRRINEAVARYAPTNGIMMVIVADNSNVDNASSQEQLQAMVTVRKVLYSHPDCDITSKIKLMMNTEYGLGKR